MEFKTLEEAQEHIVELTEQIETLEQENETLSNDNKSLTETNEKLRTLNQKYFNKLMAQDEGKPQDDDGEDDVPTCEEFAKTLNI